MVEAIARKRFAGTHAGRLRINVSCSGILLHDIPGNLFLVRMTFIGGGRACMSVYFLDGDACDTNFCSLSGFKFAELEMSTWYIFPSHNMASDPSCLTFRACTHYSSRVVRLQSGREGNILEHGWYPNTRHFGARGRWIHTPATFEGGASLKSRNSHITFHLFDLVNATLFGHHERLIVHFSQSVVSGMGSR